MTFVYRWRVQPERSGRYTVPVLTVVQGVLSAVSQVAAFDAGEVERAGDMFVRMRLPQRPGMGGRDLRGGSSSGSLPGMSRATSSSCPCSMWSICASNRRAGRVARWRSPPVRPRSRCRCCGIRSSRTVVSYTRLRFPARVSVGRPGSLDLEPVRVAARLKSGTYRDAFGFRRSRTALFQAQGERERLVVRALPEAGRPAGFVNAIGTGFSIAVSASRSVVQVGRSHRVERRRHRRRGSRGPEPAGARRRGRPVARALLRPGQPALRGGERGGERQDIRGHRTRAQRPRPGRFLPSCSCISIQSPGAMPRRTAVRWPCR